MLVNVVGVRQEREYRNGEGAVVPNFTLMSILGCKNQFSVKRASPLFHHWLVGIPTVLREED